MLTTAPYLRIRRPSPTAAEFTVSTLPPLTATLRLSLFAMYLVRGMLSCLVLLVLYATWAESAYGPSPNSSNSSSNSSGAAAPTTITTTTTHSPPPQQQQFWSQFLETVLASSPGILATALARGIDPRLAVPACLAALYALTRRPHAEESLLVLRGLGIQTRSSRRSFLAATAAAASSTRFIPTEKIRDILINEAFRGFGVRHCLVVVVDGEPDVVVVFPRLMPRRDIVERVWRGVRECLYERKASNGVAVGGGGSDAGGLGRDELRLAGSR